MEVHTELHSRDRHPKQSMDVLQSRGDRNEHSRSLRFLEDVGFSSGEKGAMQKKKEKKAHKSAIKSLLNSKTCVQDEILQGWARNDWSTVS